MHHKLLRPRARVFVRSKAKLQTHDTTLRASAQQNTAASVNAGTTQPAWIRSCILRHMRVNGDECPAFYSSLCAPTSRVCPVTRTMHSLHRCIVASLHRAAVPGTRFASEMCVCYAALGVRVLCASGPIVDVVLCAAVWARDALLRHEPFSPVAAAAAAVHVCDYV